MTNLAVAAVISDPAKRANLGAWRRNLAVRAEEADVPVGTPALDASQRPADEMRALPQSAAASVAFLPRSGVAGCSLGSEVTRTRLGTRLHPAAIRKYRQISINHEVSERGSGPIRQCVLTGEFAICGQAASATPSPERARPARTG